MKSPVHFRADMIYISYDVYTFCWLFNSSPLTCKQRRIIRAGEHE